MCTKKFPIAKVTMEKSPYFLFPFQPTKPHVPEEKLKGKKRKMSEADESAESRDQKRAREQQLIRKLSMKERPKRLITTPVIRDDSMYFLYLLLNKRKSLQNLCIAVCNMEYDASTHSLSVKENVLKHYLLSCQNAFIAIPLFIYFSADPDSDSHANMVLVRSTPTGQLQVERFEPNGKEITNKYEETQQEIDDSLTDLFYDLSKGTGTTLEYTPANQICPLIGPQAISETQVKIKSDIYLGFCQTWIYLYMEMRIQNPHQTPTEIMDSLLELPAKEMYSLVMDYAYYMKQYFDQKDVKDNVKLLIAKDRAMAYVDRAIAEINQMNLQASVIDAKITEMINRVIEAENMVTLVEFINKLETSSDVAIHTK